MKKLIPVFIFITFAAIVSGQPDVIRNAFERYNGQKGFVTITLTGEMLNMATEFQEIQLDTMLQSQLDEVRILVYEDTLEQAEVNFYNEIYDKLDMTLYKELMTVTEGDNNISVLANEKDGTITEFILVAGGSEENAIIYGKGNILLDEAMKVMGTYFKEKVTGFMRHK